MRADELSRQLEGLLNGDPNVEITGVAALDTATSRDLAYAEGRRTLDRAAAAHAGCILVPLQTSVPEKNTIAVPSPKLAFIKACTLLVRQRTSSAGIHPTAVISAEVQLGSDVTIGPLAVVERGAYVGSGTRIGAGSVIGEEAAIGNDCLLYPNVTLYPGARLGNHVILHAGVVIGADGFGYVFAEGRHQKFPQLGGVVIEDDVEIGCNTTIDRGSLGTTVIGEGTKIDNLVQIAHNVHVGRHCVIAAQTGISGSTEIGDYVMMGGQVGVGEHARIQSHAVLGGQSGVLPGKVIRSGAVVWGTPARTLEQFRRQQAAITRLASRSRKKSGGEDESKGV